MSVPAWYAVFSKPRHEGQVSGYLSSKGIEVFYPTVRVKPVNPRSATTRSFFPRYLFVHVDLDECGHGLIQWAPGVVGLVEFGGEPASITDFTMAELKRRVAEVQATGILDLAGIRKGDPVRIAQGPFFGYDAIFDTQLNGDDRVQVLLRWLGREVRLKVRADSLEKRQRSSEFDVAATKPNRRPA